MTQLAETGSVAQDGLPARAAAPRRVWTSGLLAAALWCSAAGITAYWPDLTPWSRTPLLAGAQLAVGVVLVALATLAVETPFVTRVAPQGAWFCALAVVFTAWEVLTAKTGVLPLPFFPPVQSVLEVYTDDYPRLLESILHSMLLLLPGYLLGGLAGFTAGVSIGWFKAAHYWGHPILRFVGPLPSTAWLPMAFFFFPSARSASTFLIALSTAFPVAVLTSSGINSVSKSY
ncbi:MAG TPA: hypothetical protein VI299_23385, partial [Polyangiales bacterium]